MTRRRDRIRRRQAAERTRRVMLEAIRDHRATGTVPPSRVDAAVDRAREEQQWRAVWGLP